MDQFVYRLSVFQLKSRFHQRAPKHGCAFHDTVDLPFFQDIHGFLPAVHGNDHNILPRSVSCLFDLRKCSQRHFIVMAVHHIDLTAIFCQQLPHAFGTPALQEITVHAADHFHPSVLSDRIHKPCLSLPHGRRILGSRDLHDLHMALSESIGLSDQILSGHNAFLIEIRTDQAGGKSLFLRVNVPVHQDHGDPRILCLLQHIIPAFFHNGRKCDHIHLVGNEPPDRSDLIFLLLVCILQHQADPVLSGLLFDIPGVADSPRTLGAQLAEAQQKLRVLRLLL